MVCDIWRDRDCQVRAVHDSDGNDFRLWVRRQAMRDMRLALRLVNLQAASVQTIGCLTANSDSPIRAPRGLRRPSRRCRKLSFYDPRVKSPVFERPDYAAHVLTSPTPPFRFQHLK